MMDFITSFSILNLLFVGELLVRIVVAIRIIMRRLSVGTSLAWLVIVLLVPMFGALLYLLLGELRLGNRRARWASVIHEPFQRWLSLLNHRIRVDWSKLPASSRSLSRLAEAGVGIPALPGNHVELIQDTDDVFNALIKDIDRAKRTCHLEFYIWGVGGRADEVIEALIRARERDVRVRILVDAVGGRPFLRSRHSRRLREAGVHLHSALPAGLFRMLFVRFDLRLHRKIVVIDGEVGYTGSMNLVDPEFFKRNRGVGKWIDAMVRVRGPAVEALAITFLEDWELETSEGVHSLEATGDVHALAEIGDSVVHVIPSGPAIRRDAIDRVLLTKIYDAGEELVITTPYFVPDESLLVAILSASRRGVKVKLIMPERIDSLFVRLACKAHFDELLDAGVEIFLYRTGLLHTKSITVDGTTSLFGSLNLDPRSLHLNFEISLLIHCRKFTRHLRGLQEQYLRESRRLIVGPQTTYKFPHRLAINAVRLIGPLL